MVLNAANGWVSLNKSCKMSCNWTCDIQIEGSPIDQVGPVCGSKHSCKPCETLLSPFTTPHNLTFPLRSYSTYRTRFFLVIDQLGNLTVPRYFSPKRTFILSNQLIGGLQKAYGDACRRVQHGGMEHNHPCGR